MVIPKNWHGFQNPLHKTCDMEMRERNNERKRRKPVSRNPVLVRSVKPGQTSTLVWEKETSANTNIWKS
jgi:hypothetical protein